MSHYRNLVQQLSAVYPPGEASSIARWVMEDCFGLSQTDLLLDKDSNLSANDVHDLQIIAQRLLKKEPLQYVLGRTTFCGLTFEVQPGVLIPRPETAELVEWIASLHGAESDSSAQVGDASSAHRLRVLDIGTGSGCIALSLASRGFDVEAWDISEDALLVARRNAERLSLDVRFSKQDILQQAEQLAASSEVYPAEKTYTVIVSNPPYICQKEASEMEANVLDYEPHLALFVPDSDPLLFYRAIARFACVALSDGGELFFEINRAYGNEVADMLRVYGYEDVEVRQDQFGNDRMVRAVLYHRNRKDYE